MRRYLLGQGCDAFPVNLAGFLEHIETRESQLAAPDPFTDLAGSLRFLEQVGEQEDAQDFSGSPREEGSSCEVSLQIEDQNACLILERKFGADVEHRKVLDGALGVQLRELADRR